jgi:colicin import membrane protein
MNKASSNANAHANANLNVAQANWNRLAQESEGSKFASLSFAVILHGILFGLMYVGFATANVPDPTDRAGVPITFALIDIPKALQTVIDKPVPAQRMRKPVSKPQAAPVDDVTDHKPIVEAPKMPDPLAIEEQDAPDPRKQEEIARQQALEDLIKQKEQAAKEREQKQREMAQVQEDIAARSLAQAIADEEAGLTGDNADNSLLAQYRSALASTIEQRSHVSRDLREGFLCWVRVTQLPGGEVMSVVPQAKCNATAQERAELVEGVMRASPLPYSGFEPVFDRLVDIPFQAQGQ